MTKEAAIKQFFSGFGITAYPSTAEYLTENMPGHRKKRKE